MSLTVGEVIGLDVVQRGRPQVLSSGRWDEPIRWVHVGDIPDMSALLLGGELVLTTGTALNTAPEVYLRGLADAGALGVVVELGTAMHEVPQSVTDLARSLGLALVALRRQIKFVDVTEAVHRQIVAAQFDEVAFDRKVHETFTELSVRRASVSSIVDAAARILDQPVVLEDLAHQALAVSARGEPAAELLKNWERRSRRNPTEGGGAEPWVITSVGLRGEEWGRLLIPSPPAEPGRARMVLERAATALALHRMIEQNRTGLHQQAQSGLIDDVLQGRIADEREIAARAHALGLRKVPRYLPMVVRVDGLAGGVDPVAAQRLNVNLLETVVHTVNASGHTGLFSVRGPGEIGGLVALNPGRASADKALSEIGQQLRRDIGRSTGGKRSVCAVAQPGVEIADSIRGLAEAAHIAEVALAMGDAEARDFHRAADVRLRGLISLLRDDPRVQQFAETELKAMLAEDPAAHHGLTDLQVLRAYLQLGGNKVALAKRLHVSRPALYKRLAAISDKLGVPLDDAESMTSLHVAMMVQDARRRRESPAPSG